MRLFLWLAYDIGLRDRFVKLQGDYRNKICTSLCQHSRLDSTAQFSIGNIGDLFFLATFSVCISYFSRASERDSRALFLSRRDQSLLLESHIRVAASYKDEISVFNRVLPSHIRKTIHLVATNKEVSPFRRKAGRRSSLCITYSEYTHFSGTLTPPSIQSKARWNC